MGEKIRVGVVGVGYLGSIHARIYSGMSDVELAGVMDIDAAVAGKVAGKTGCPVFHDAAELLDQVQAVSIAVPTCEHSGVARPFLERGIAVLLEKPVAPDYHEAEQLVRLAERSGSVLQVGHLERFNAGVVALSNRCRNPRFIEVHRMSPFLVRATDVDVVTDLMIHDIDIVLALVGDEIRSVSAVGVPVLTDLTDIANARLEFANGAVANITASRVSDRKFRRLRVFGKHRYDALNFVDQQIESVVAEAEKSANGKLQVVREEIAVSPCHPLDRELEAFVHCVRTGEPPLVDGRTGLQALAVALQIRQAIERGGS